MGRSIIGVGTAIVLAVGSYFLLSGRIPLPSGREVGRPVDSLNGVYVYYNGSVGNVSGRNLADDGYNLGLRYQCVEFVKRYYYEHLEHRMPDSYGHAKDFFDASIGDGRVNPARNLLQYRNPGASSPRVDDLLVFDATSFNPYGHVAIVSAVDGDELEIIQQNPGPLASSRDRIKVVRQGRSWRVDHGSVLGWLRKK